MLISPNWYRKFTQSGRLQRVMFLSLLGLNIAMKSWQNYTRNSSLEFYHTSLLFKQWPTLPLLMVITHGFFTHVFLNDTIPLGKKYTRHILKIIIRFRLMFVLILSAFCWPNRNGLHNYKAILCIDVHIES